MPLDKPNYSFKLFAYFFFISSFFSPASLLSTSKLEAFNNTDTATCWMDSCFILSRKTYLESLQCCIYVLFDIDFSRLYIATEVYNLLYYFHSETTQGYVVMF